MAQRYTQGELRECCSDERNLILQPPELDAQGQPVRSADFEIRRCRVCDRKHVTLNVDPGVIGVRMS